MIISLKANLGEPGAAGTVYRSHQNDGKTTSTLQINNDFNKIRVRACKAFYFSLNTLFLGNDPILRFNQGRIIRVGC